MALVLEASFSGSERLNAQTEAQLQEGLNHYRTLILIRGVRQYLFYSDFFSFFDTNLSS